MVVVLLLSLPLWYVAAYVGLYHPVGPLLRHPDGGYKIRHYQYGGRAPEIIFAPLEALDWRETYPDR
jgi:hypothetical protein